MICDNELRLSGTPQAITTTDISEHIYDRGVAEDGFIGDQNLTPVLTVTEAFNTLTSLTVTIESSAAAGLTSARVHSQLTIPLAQLTVNSVHRLPIPKGQKSLRYIGARYTVVGSDPTTGEVILDLVKDAHANVESS
jgi:hypothetical protein